jgi:hypothetical protein
MSLHRSDLRLLHRDRRFGVGFAFCARSVPERRTGVQLSELRDALGKLSLRDDRVPPIDALGLVSNELHGDRARDAGTFEVPNRRASEVVRNRADALLLSARIGFAGNTQTRVRP